MEERAALRQEYLNAVMANARSVLENTYIVDEKGNKRKLRGKGEGGSMSYEYDENNGLQPKPPKKQQ